MCQSLLSARASGPPPLMAAQPAYQRTRRASARASGPRAWSAYRRTRKASPSCSIDKGKSAAVGPIPGATVTQLARSARTSSAEALAVPRKAQASSATHCSASKPLPSAGSPARARYGVNCNAPLPDLSERMTQVAVNSALPETRTFQTYQPWLGKGVIWKCTRGTCVASARATCSWLSYSPSNHARGAADTAASGVLRKGLLWQAPSRSAASSGRSSVGFGLFIGQG